MLSRVLIQKERSISLGVTVSALWENKIIWACVQFWRVTEMELFESPDLTLFCFCLWGWLMNEVYKKERWIHNMNCSLAIWMPLPEQRNVISSDEQHAIFVHELRCALRLTVGFSNIYCEL